MTKSTREYEIEDWQALCIDLRAEAIEWRQRALTYEIKYLEERQWRMELQAKQRNEQNDTRHSG